MVYKRNRISRKAGLASHMRSKKSPDVRGQVGRMSFLHDLGKTFASADDSQAVVVDDEAQVDQQHLPDAIKHRTYYHPSDRGYEKTVQERLDAFEAARRKTKKT